MRRVHDFTGDREEDLVIRQLILRTELLAITEELDRREEERNGRPALKPEALDYNDKIIHVGDRVTLRTKSRKGTPFAKETEAIVVGWNTRQTDIVIRKIRDDGTTTTRRRYNLIIEKND